MAKTESTAVNQLIANVSGRPLNPDNDVDSSWDELTFENPPMAAAPEPVQEKRSTRPQVAVPPPTPVRRSTTMGHAVHAEGTPAPEPVVLESLQSVTQTQPGMGAAAVKLASSPAIAVPAAPPVVVSESPVHVPAVPGVKPTWLATPAGRAPVSSQMPAVMPNGTIPPPMTLAPEHLDPQHPFNRDLTAPAAMVNGEDWFLESSQAVPTVEETDIGTQSVRKAPRKLPLGLIAGLGSVAALAAVFVGGYLMFDGSSGGKSASAAPAPAPAVAAEPAKAEPAAEPEAAKPTPTRIATLAETAAEPAVEPAAVPEPTPAPAPAPTPVPAPAPAPAPAPSAELVDVLFLSNPPGANVVLVDDGKTIPIGATPVSASIDASHTYEAVFALEGHQTRIEKLDPKRDRKFSIDLRSGKATIAKAAEPAPAPAPAPAAAKTEPTPAPKAEPKAKAKAEPKRGRSKKVAAADPPKAEAKKAAEPAPAGSGGAGVLMVAAKPPCEIFIDGKATGLMTPQRSIDLPAGTHKVTLVNKDAKIKKTIAIKITAGKPTKLIQDYTSELP